VSDPDELESQRLFILREAFLLAYVERALRVDDPRRLAS